MIRLTRPQRPDALGTRAEPYREEARSWFRASGTRKSQLGRFRFRSEIWRTVKSDLLEMSHGKCAFCESRIDLPSQGGDVEHFRPTTNAMDQNGEVSARHYWWLAYEWTNLFPICPACNSNKRSRFPVAGRRVGAEAMGPELDLEKALLLDPTSDTPEEHLVFDDEGIVADVFWLGSDQPPGDSQPQRGMVTIDTFGLNRSPLVEARTQAIAQTISVLDKLVASRQLEDDENPDYQALLAPEREYSMACRQAVLRYLGALEEMATVDQDVLGKRAYIASPIAQTVQIDAGVRKQAFEKLEKREQDFVGLSIDSEDTFARSPHVSSVSIRNFKGIVSLDLDLSETGWTMLVGENGTGKSSVLQALSLALMGAEVANRLVASEDIDPIKLIRNGTSKAVIEVRRVADREPLVVDVTREGIHYRTTHQQKAVLLGFGSARWQPHRGSLSPDSDDYVRVRNLYNPFVPIGNAEEWMVGLGHRTSEYAAANETLRRLLALGEADEIRIRQGILYLERNSEDESVLLTIDQLSDGYQTVLAMAAGIMSPLMLKAGPELTTAEGVVLVDELDAHLHPRWKMRIVQDLRTAFPAVQFITTTHEPLCLRGLEAGEVVVLELDGGRISARASQVSPNELTVEQLLTSSLFGLHTTLDPEREAKLNRYYELLAMTSRTDPEQRELRDLQTEVGSTGLLGRSPRDQAVLLAIDQKLSQTGMPSDAVISAADEEVVARFEKVLAEADESTSSALSDILEGL